jgi:hypothetical protein
MKISRILEVGLSIFAGLWLLVVPPSFAGASYVLANGTQGQVDGKRLILIEANGKRSVAPPGRYETRDGHYTIVVRGETVVIRDNTRTLR